MTSIRCGCSYFIRASVKVVARTFVNSRDDPCSVTVVKRDLCYWKGRAAKVSVSQAAFATIKKITDSKMFRSLFFFHLPTAVRAKAFPEVLLFEETYNKNRCK